jgi:choline kinase
MKAIILAAGIGSRLRPLTDRTPKCLIEVNGKPILAYQLEALSRCATLQEIIIVAGYRHSDIYDFVNSTHATAPTRVIVNSYFETTNNMYSLGLAIEELAGQDILVLNGDVVFAPEIMVKATTMLTTHSVIACDSSVYYEESMKVVVASDDRVVRISKAIPEEDASAVSIDLYRFTGNCSMNLYHIVRRTIWDQGIRNKWTEVAVDELLDHHTVRPLDISPLPWVEIDDHNDLMCARRMFE